MLKTMNAVNTLLGTVLGLAIVGLIGTGAWFGYHAYYAEQIARQDMEAQLDESKAKLVSLSQEVEDKTKRISVLTEDNQQKAEQITSLEAENAAKQKEIDRLDTALRLLKVDTRVARIEVLNQTGSDAEDNLATKFSFAELDRQGNPVEEPRIFTIDGDVVYLDTWVAKFGDEFVELGDPLRSTSICLFRRVFGEKQQPNEGFPLDPVGRRPAAYANGQASDLEKDIWARFWEYANDAKLAEKAGVRAAHGDAPSIRLMPGKKYRVLLRSSGGLSIVPETVGNGTSG